MVDLEKNIKNVCARERYNSNNIRDQNIFYKFNLEVGIKTHLLLITDISY